MQEKLFNLPNNQFPFYNENGTFLCGNYQPSSWFHLTLKFESPATAAAAAVARRERDVIPQLRYDGQVAIPVSKIGSGFIPKREVKKKCAAQNI